MELRSIQLVVTAALLLAGLGQAGCASQGPTRTTLELAPGQYAGAFEAARAVLIEMDFDLNRVDARAGVISTRTRQTAGLATPWDAQQTGLGDEFADLVAAHARSVRVTFEPRGAPDAQIDSPAGLGTRPVDLMGDDGPLVMRVSAVLWRRQRPGRRIETESIRRSGFWRDPMLIRRRMQLAYAVPVRQDPDLAARIAQRILARLEGSP